MIQSIYSSVSNADIVFGKKGTVITSNPIPLLRDNFLGEYRTELEKAKVRKNLGIPDENSLSWGNIEGFVESQKDLVEYVESKWNYTTELNEDVNNIKDAMDYALYFVTNFKGEHDSIIVIEKDIQSINENIETLTNSISNSNDNIKTIENDIQTLNSSIEQLNKNLLEINVDSNILAWVQKYLNNSKTIKITEDSLELIVSEQPNNALQILEYVRGVEEDLENGVEKVEEVLPGLYIKDLSTDIKQLEDNQTQTNQNLLEIQDTMSQLNESLEQVSYYTTETSDSTKVPTSVGGIQAGTTAAQLKGKTLIQVLDTILFPEVWTYPKAPTLRIGVIKDLVKVGSSVQVPVYTFTRNDAGEEVERIVELLDKTGNPTTSTTYFEYGTFTHKCTVSYLDGKCAVNNRGDENCEYQIKAGSLEVTKVITTTYPWYIGSNENSQLVKIGNSSGEIEITLSGKAVIKLPGVNSAITSFQLDSGIGFTDVNMDGWEKSTESLNGITYNVWTKLTEYNNSIKHKINFKLQL